jgi:predicted nuclease of predicted toxin-antitoxin system
MDFKSALAARLEGQSDPTVLNLAAHEDRILVTQDIRTMPQHFAEFL